MKKQENKFEYTADQQKKIKDFKKQFDKDYADFILSFNIFSDKYSKIITGVYVGKLHLTATWDLAVATYPKQMEIEALK